MTINYPSGVKPALHENITKENKPVKKSKYNNQKVIVDGYKFDSKKEANRYLELKQWQKEGKIKNLQRQVKIEIQPSFKFGNKTIRSINYVADFVYYDIKKDIIVYEDTKGFKTDIYKIKYKLLLYKNIKINEL